MCLDKKQMRGHLANLKSMGYIIETTGVSQWAKTQKYNRGRNQNSGKAAEYHVDYRYFIMMTKFRLTQILKRLNAQQEKEDDTGDGYVCSNEACFLCYKVKKVMDLILEQQRSYKLSHNSHFVCSECGQPLTDAQKYYDNQNSTLTKTMTFNLQMKSLSTLLRDVEKKVIRERQGMSVEIRKLEDQLERIQNGSGHSSYKAATLRFDNNKFKKGKGGGTGLAHLDRIGRRRDLINKKNFRCQIEEDQADNDNKQNDDGKLTEKDEQQRIEEERQFQREVKDYVNVIKKYEMNRNINVNIGGDKHDDDDDDDIDIDLYPSIMLKVDGVEVALSDILKDTEKYELRMKNEEYLEYQKKLDELGLVEID